MSQTRLSSPLQPALRFRWSTIMLWGSAVVVTAALLLPSTYLLVRGLETPLEGWQQLLRLQTLQIIFNTLILALAVTFASTLIAVPLAWFTVRTDLPLRRFWLAVTPLPLVIPSYVGAYLIASALGPRGMLQQWLEPVFGITRLPEIYGFPGALFTLTLLTYPYILLSVRAVLLNIDPALEEASRSLGHTPWQTFWRVTWPLLRPALGAGGLLVALYVLRDFGAVALMRYDTFTRIIYTQYRSFDRSQAALMALMLVALTLVIVILETRTRSRARYFQSGTGASQPPALTPLGVWRWPAAAFCALVTGLALVMPTGMLVYWLVRGMLAGETVPQLGLAAVNSVVASALGALVTVAAALPIAVLAVRRPGHLTRMLERITYSAFALPGIVVALALVFFGVNYALPLYQTLPMLLLAYVILFLPQAVGAARASLLQIHPSLQEAAQSLGRKPWQVFVTITLPLIQPGLVSGAALVFLTAMKELPATLILAPIGYRTLAASVWSAVSEAYFAQAAAPALLIILMSSVPLAILSARSQNVNP